MQMLGERGNSSGQPQAGREHGGYNQQNPTTETAQTSEASGPSLDGFDSDIPFY